MKVLIQAEPFDPGEELNVFSRRQDAAGAVVSFTGIVRDVDDALLHMEIEHYPAMTEAAIKDICQKAKSNWDVEDLLVIHRYGKLAPREMIMMVATSSKHRADAFAAADFLMDHLKSRAPFWKKEVTSKGEEWVLAKDDDEAALRRWSSA